MKKIIILGLILISIILSGCTETNSNIANPVTEKCVYDGGTVRGTGGMDSKETKKICVFSDQSYCNIEEFFEGTCQQGQNFMKCIAVGTRSEGFADADLTEFLYYDNCAKCIIPQNCEKFDHGGCSGQGEWLCAEGRCQWKCQGV